MKDKPKGINQMKTLHLISDGRMRHSIHVEDSKTNQFEVAVQNLKNEAEGIKNTIIICDQDNMPASYIEFSSEVDSQHKEDYYLLAGLLLVLGLSYTLLS